jgi:hypothetical protein
MTSYFYSTSTNHHRIEEEKRKRRGASRRARRSRARTRTRIDDLEDDIGYLSLVLGVLLQKVDEKGLITREEVESSLASLDQFDGEQDGKLDVDVLRRAAGESTPKSAPESEG